MFFGVLNRENVPLISLRYNVPPGLAETVLKAFYKQLWNQDWNLYIVTTPFPG